MHKLPKKLRKALRNLPRAKKIQGHRHEIAKAFDRYDRTDVRAPHPTRWRGPW
jgi:hypothetical protein